MRLLLIRHGHSHHAVTNTIADLRGCQGLTPEGLAQARALSERVRRWPDAAEWPILLSSPVPRAHQTAEVLREALRLDAIVPVPDLREQVPGEADGLQRDAYRARYGTFNPQHEPDRPFSPGGESWKDFESRVAWTLEELAQRYAGRNVLAVTHAGFIVTAFLKLLAITAWDRAWLDPSNTGITEWRFDDARWRLGRYNDTSHLG